MNRHGGSEAIRSAVRRLRAAIPDIVLRTTVITGFPGETEAEFEELCTYIKEEKFQHLGAFAYSREDGTPAASFPDQIDEQLKQDRADKIMETQLEITDAYNREKLHKTIEVLCEGFDPVAETYYGRSAADAPEIDGKVYFTSAQKCAEGEFVQVKVTEVMDYDLIGEAVK